MTRRRMIREGVSKRPTEAISGFAALVLLTIKVFSDIKFTDEQEYVLLTWLGALPLAITYINTRFFTKKDQVVVED
jgi:hypothetical protein